MRLMHLKTVLEKKIKPIYVSQSWGYPLYRRLDTEQLQTQLGIRNLWDIISKPPLLAANKIIGSNRLFHRSSEKKYL